MRINCVNLLILTLILPGCTHRAPLNTSANDGRASANAKTIATLNVAANNPNHSIIHRSQAIFTLFRGFIKPGCPVQDVQAILRDPRWLDHARIYGCYTITGWLPLFTDLSSTTCVL